MASIKVKFRFSTLAHREGTIYYQVIHQRKVRQILTGYRLFPHEWSATCSSVRISPHTERAPLLRTIRESIGRDLARLSHIVRKMEIKGIEYSSDDLVDAFKRYSSDYTLFNYMEKIISRLRETEKIRTAETYATTLNSFRKYRKNEDIHLDVLNSEIMESYQAWQRQRGVVPNTVSFYIRIIRAVYHRAVEEDIITDRNPFRRVYTGVAKTVKRALPLTTIREIRSLDLSCMPALDYARDMFILSLMLRGMSLIDMAFLRKNDLKNGFLTYRRRKTGQLLIVEWTEEMQNILDKYPENESNYLLPIIRRKGTNERCAYKNAGDKINQNLKKIAKQVGIYEPLSLYVARHSWATIAKSAGVPLRTISEGMGHDSERTTQIYLASIDRREVDKANAMLIGLL